MKDAWVSALIGHDFYAVKIPTYDIPLMRRHADLNVVDVNLTFECKPKIEDCFVPPENLKIDFAKAYQFASVLKIAEISFKYSRFHLDPDVPRETANKIKKEWMANSLNGKRGNGVLVAELPQGVVGFLATLGLKEEDQRIGVIDLIAVVNGYQRQGIGQALIEAFFHYTNGLYDIYRVGTQAANITSIRLYEKMGFRMVGSTYVLHGHG